MLKVYALSVLAMFKEDSGFTHYEHAASWLIYDERVDVTVEAERLMFEWFPKKDHWFNHSFNVMEVPLKVMKRAVEVNLYEEVPEPPVRRATAQSKQTVAPREQTRQPVPTGRDRRQEEPKRRLLYHRQ